MAVPKHTRNEPQALVVSGHCIDVPPNVYVMPSLLAMHTHPEHWGIDALEWRPSRWITSDSKFFEPQKGSYFPWSQGAQNCPGNKFSQVEFVAVLAAVFRYHRVQPLCNERENEESARKCLAGAVQEISHGVLLSMKDADGFRYLWRKVD
jgi:cytochrome P450